MGYWVGMHSCSMHTRQDSPSLKKSFVGTVTCFAEKEIDGEKQLSHMV